MNQAITHTPQGIRIEASPELFIPESDLEKVDRIGEEMRAEDETHRAAGKVECANPDCGEWFKPRNGSGGKPQRFCSPECRQAFHAEQKPNVPNVGQRTTLPALIPATQDRKEDENRFDWSSDDSVCLQEQPATAMYFNKAGSLVIRQMAAWDQDEDSFVFVTPENLQGFIDRLCDMAGIPSAGK